MKRYTKLKTIIPHHSGSDYVIENRMVLRSDGEWVKWEDAENACNSIREFDEFIEKHNKALKVFCRDCIHLGRSWSCGHGNGDEVQYCTSPLNKKETWYAPDVDYAQTPQERNKNNDCTLFERK